MILAESVWPAEGGKEELSKPPDSARAFGGSCQRVSSQLPTQSSHETGQWRFSFLKTNKNNKTFNSLKVISYNTNRRWKKASSASSRNHYLAHCCLHSIGIHHFASLVQLYIYMLDRGSYSYSRRDQGQDTHDRQSLEGSLLRKSHAVARS